jgi:hypothetical protein
MFFLFINNLAISRTNFISSERQNLSFKVKNIHFMDILYCLCHFTGIGIAIFCLAFRR